MKKLTYNENQEKVFKSTISGYMGQLTIRLPFMGKSAASFGAFMFLGRGLIFNDSGRVTLRHEHGHYLDYKRIGFFRFIFGVCIPSIVNASRKPERRRIIGYYNQPWEIHADVLANVVRNEHTEEALALSKAYYEHLMSIRKMGWFKFIFRDLRKFINHDFTAINVS